ncbi:hypothetical protein PIB30_040122 [Stylosanthes scabra]|uniref:Uncharacterized protein n=1 Tax=Stylosanthes scabra TaxID=79078 RepID=A0ABU6SEF7_9FABA|nr:hypothetical protein [Stylosanthes scabra]
MESEIQIPYLNVGIQSKRMNEFHVAANSASIGASKRKLSRFECWSEYCCFSFLFPPLFFTSLNKKFASESKLKQVNDNNDKGVPRPWVEILCIPMIAAMSQVLIPRWIRVNPCYWSKLTSGAGMAVESAVNNLVLNEIVEPAVTRPTAHIEWRWSLQSNNRLSKELVEPAVTRPTTRIPMITVVNSCRRDLTLANRSVRIAVTDLTPFLPIRFYGGLAAKVIWTFHPAAETLWDSTRY